MQNENISENKKKAKISKIIELCKIAHIWHFIRKHDEKACAIIRL